jgi:glucose-6-phosphate isomerase
MNEVPIKLYYKNVTSQVIGTEEGITPEGLRLLAEKTVPILKQINEERKAGKTPYRDLPYNKQTPRKVKDLVAKLKDRCHTVVVLGIGGSALGNTALQTALNPYMYNIDDKQRKGPRFFVFDNVDPPQLASFLDWLDDKLDGTIFNVISKSGRTAETASQFLTVQKVLLKKLGENGFKNQVVATTDAQKGTLRNIANDAGLDSLVVPDGVGGRFSVLSAVGLFGAAMCSIDIEGLLAGAADMDKRVSDEDFQKNPAGLAAAINWYFYNHGKKIAVMMPYSHHLKDFADWYRQLWAESLGKAKDLHDAEVHVGPTPVKALGTTDQHSQVQLYREGPNDKIFTFLQVNNFDKDLKIGPAPDFAPELEYLAGKKLSKLLNSEKQATEYALLVNKRPCLTIIFDSVNAHSVGQFIYLYEVVTSIAGALFGINTYDQPAVELGKEATFALMGHADYKELAKKMKPFTSIDDYFLV